jgi:endogenous inhibitor of DNA gyrase (YacG/DUF329 family)
MPLRTCEWCTTPVRQSHTGRIRRFCDGTCRQAAYRAQLLAEEYPEPWQRRALAAGWRTPATTL